MTPSLKRCSRTARRSFFGMRTMAAKWELDGELSAAEPVP
eukprot:CAMPEP_0115134028 /NCGR_PEP_ID=MMETSP0227-20121206/54827_1 /TAXON_ID=89957 /ORGANISM="Polarella glacialis, Strain CCMP 1383" /LENGTH=39 /DNA_ID= /DNA_START= /DNA_END= /DNA_ORIENTATION=